MAIRPWELLEANEQALADIDGRIDGAVHESVSIDGPVVVESGATVEAGASIRGPTLIEQDATVRSNAHIRGGTVIGEGASIGRAVEIENSLIIDGANVQTLAYVGDSIVGPEATLGPGTVTTNHHEDAEVQSPGDAPETLDRDQLGAVIGPGVETGNDTTLKPGAVLAAEAQTGAGETVTPKR